MAKCIINESADDATTVEGAASVAHADGYFYFRDASKVPIYIADAKLVRTIKRTD